MHSVLGSWQILNVKERKDETFVFEIENSCFFESVLPMCAVIKVKYLYLETYLHQMSQLRPLFD